MSTITAEPVASPEVETRPKTNYLTARYGIRSWLLTGDHKRIAILYLISVSVMFFVGGLFATAIRLELLTPKGDLFSGDTYNKVFTLHGVVMIFFFLIPVIPAVLGNFLVPMMIGAKDLAFPKINLLSWYLYMIGAALAVWVLLNGGVDTGWTFYTPYSSDPTKSKTDVVPTIVAAFILGMSSILTGLNFIVTIHTMRAPGMTWGRMPLFLWASYATSLIIILATPVVGIALILVLVERVAQVGIFDPNLGGDPILFQHLFWFYSHPAVYIMILPAMGVISELICNFSRKGIFGYDFVAGSSIAIAAVGFLVWGHHMFVAGQSLYAGMIFSILSMLVAVPSAVKVFNWTATMYGGSVAWDTPMLYAMGFLGLFTVGGLTGMYLASTAVDVHLHDTYFVVAHFHFVMVGGTVMAYLGGLHYWWPKITGRLYPELWGRVSAVVIFVGFNFTFFPQFVLGNLGMPRRYHEYRDHFQVLNVMSTAGASVLGLGFLLPVVYLTWSLWYGKKAGPNPYGAADSALEWQTPSPPPTENFEKPVTATLPPYTWVSSGRKEADVVG